jgi:anthranilate phosphoribosyltransferase
MKLCETWAHRLEPEGEFEAHELGEILPWLWSDLVPEVEKFAFLSAWAARGETPREIACLAKELLRESVPIPVRGHWQGRPIADTCGTGGGGLSLFNVSTAAMFVCAAAGICVLKHGNRGFTKPCGSADVLRALGVKVELDPEEITTWLEELGMAFVYAPRYHPLLGKLSGLRRRMGLLGQRSVFHFVGPLLNPSRPAVQLVGVFVPEDTRKIAFALKELGCERAVTAYGLDDLGVPLGEMGTNGAGLLVGLSWGSLRRAIRSWGWVRRYRGAARGLFVESAEHSASLIEAILAGIVRGFARGLVVVNSALVLMAGERAKTFEEAAEIAELVIDRGFARQKLRDARVLSSSTT